MKKIYLAISVEENGKYYAFADTIKVGENLMVHVGRYKADVLHLCESKKEAEELVMRWNAVHKANGTFLFSEPNF